MRATPRREIHSIRGLLWCKGASLCLVASVPWVGFEGTVAASFLTWRDTCFESREQGVL